MRILVTGGAGFIGSHLADKLISGNEVFVIDDLSGGDVRNVSKYATFHKADCRNADEMDDLIMSIRPDIVYHLACNAAENKAQFSPIDITSRNYDAFIKVLTPFIKAKGKRFIFTSSIAVYGSLQTPFIETDTPEPEDLYGISKLAIEQTLKVMSKVHGFEYIVARPHNVYGPRQNMCDPYRNVVTIWMNSILRNEPYVIYGDGEQKRCFSYINDVVSALQKCSVTKISNTIYNIGSDTYYTLNDLHTALHMVVERSIKKPQYLPLRPQEVINAIADHTQAINFLGYEDVTPLLDGLRKTWVYCKKQGKQDPIYTNIEINSDKLPKNWV